jgi:hypothetical protein
MGSVWISEQLKEHGHEVIVANAAALHAISRNHLQSDRIIPEKLARLRTSRSKDPTSDHTSDGRTTTSLTVKASSLWFDSGSLYALRSLHAVSASPFFESTLCGIVLSSVGSATSCLTSTGSEMLGPSLLKRPFIVQGRNLRNSIMKRLSCGIFHRWVVRLNPIDQPQNSKISLFL